MIKKPYSHVEMQSDFLGQFDLAKALLVFKAAQPVGGFFDIFLAGESIDIPAIIAKGVLAKGFDDIKIAKLDDAHISIQSRNHQMGPIIPHMKGAFQFLKESSPSAFANLTYWGADPTVTGRFRYPTNPHLMLAMYKKFWDKDHSYPGITSPIHNYNIEQEIDMTVDGNRYTAAKGNDDDAANEFSLSEQNTQLRNNKWAPCLIDLLKIYHFLKAYYGGNTQKMRKAGFIILQTPPTHKKQKSKALQLGHVGIHGAIIGSIAYNPNDFAIILIPGTDIEGEAITFPAHSAMAIAPGMSRFIFKNPDALRIAEMTVMIRKTAKK